MAHRLFFSTFLFILLTPTYPQEIPGSNNFTDQDGMKQGSWKVHYPDGTLRYIGTFRNDRPVGEFIRYFPNGNKMAEMYFCDSGIRARATLFYRDGTMAATGLYVNEKKDSVWNYFSYYDKRPAFFETYNNGVREGASGVYYPDGSLTEVFWYEEDKRNGPWQQYYENGAVRIDAIFRDDQRHGEFRVYSASGILEISGEYYKNQMHGKWTWFDNSGREKSVVDYVYGKPENEEELIEKEQEMFRMIQEMRGLIPEPDESELFSPRGY